jgi:hypothetical protein
MSVMIKAPYLRFDGVTTYAKAKPITIHSSQKGQLSGFTASAPLLLSLLGKVFFISSP